MEGAYLTYRIALANDSRKFSDGNSDSALAPFHCNRAKITTTKQRAFTAKTQFAPRKYSRTPPSAGPMIPETFNCSPPSAAAEGSSSSVTKSGTIADHAGA